MQHEYTAHENSYRKIKIRTRTYISDKDMIEFLKKCEKNIRDGPNAKELLAKFALHANELETIKPLMETDIVKVIFKYFEGASDNERDSIFTILSAIIETSYKHVIVTHHLDVMMDITQASLKNSDDDEDKMEKGLKIFKELAEIDEIVTEKILKLGGLEIILRACKTKSDKVAKACAIAILHIILFGGKHCASMFMKHNMNKWSLPFLNIPEQLSTKYYAYFTLIYLQSVYRITHEYKDYGIMDYIVHWLSENEIHLINEVSLVKGTNAKKLVQKILPLLTSKSRIAQALGTFQVCCDLSNNMDGREAFNDPIIINSLRRVAVYSNSITSHFATHALSSLTSISHGRTLKRIPFKSIAEWNEKDVENWLRIFDFDDYVLFFSKVNGEKLVGIKDHDLKLDYFMVDPSKRKHFFEERSILCEESSTKMIQRAHIEAIVFPDDNENNDAICNGTVHESTISLEEKMSIIESPFDPTKKKYDVFISYRRKGGDDLASYLCYFLRNNNYKVFFDIVSLRSGRFSEKLKNSIQQSQNFLLILTHDALERCVNENDWMRIEIEMALKSGCNIIPVTKSFNNEYFDQVDLPDNVKQLQHYNQITWHHDSQGSCLDKIEEYIEPRKQSCRYLKTAIKRVQQKRYK